MSFFQRSAMALLLFCVGCAAQTQAPADLSHSIEQHLRAYFQLPDEVSVQIGERTPSEFPDYDKLAVTLVESERKQQVTFLISKDNKTLVRFTKMDLTKDPYTDVMNKINLAQRPWRGNSNAKVVLVNYDDFECPFCARLHQSLFGEIYRTYSDRIKIIYKDYPLSEIHPWATRAAVDANCLAAQNNDSYWAFADAIHNNARQISGEKKPLAQQLEAIDAVARAQGQRFPVDMDKLNACLQAQDETAVKASVKEAEQLGVQSTPTMFIKGHKVEGAVPEQVRAAIEKALRETATAGPASGSGK